MKKIDIQIRCLVEVEEIVKRMDTGKCRWLEVKATSQLRECVCMYVYVSIL